MPRYEYRCGKGHDAVVAFRFGEAPKQLECHCGDVAIRRFSVPSIVVYMNAIEAYNFYSSPEGQKDYKDAPTGIVS